MEGTNFKIFLYLILIGALIIYVIYRVNNKFKKEDMPFGVNAEIGLVALILILALFIIHFIFK
jgi:hypothetical protein